MDGKSTEASEARQQQGQAKRGSCRGKRSAAVAGASGNLPKKAETAQKSALCFDVCCVYFDVFESKLFAFVDAGGIATGQVVVLLPALFVCIGGIGGGFVCEALCETCEGKLSIEML